MIQYCHMFAFSYFETFYMPPSLYLSFFLIWGCSGCLTSCLKMYNNNRAELCMRLYETVFNDISQNIFLPVIAFPCSL